MNHSADPWELRDYFEDDERFLDFCREFSGCQIYVPKYENLVRNRRDYNICVQYFDNEVPVSFLAKKYRLTERAIYKILARRDEIYAAR